MYLKRFKAAKGKLAGLRERKHWLSRRKIDLRLGTVNQRVLFKPTDSASIEIDYYKYVPVAKPVVEPPPNEQARCARRSQWVLLAVQVVSQSPEGLYISREVLATVVARPSRLKLLSLKRRKRLASSVPLPPLQRRLVRNGKCNGCIWYG